MAKTEYVTVRLTRLEAEALNSAAGPTLCSTQDALQTLLTMRNVRAAYRAAEKLEAAIRGKNHG